MAAEAAFLALDLGAESGRAVLGRFDGERMSFDEVHRFPNVPVKLVDGTHWDALQIFAEVKEGLKKAVAEAGRVDSLGVDSWGVDFGLLDRDGSLVSNPYYYRDPRTEGTEERALEGCQERRSTVRQASSSCRSTPSTSSSPWKTRL